MIIFVVNHLAIINCSSINLHQNHSNTIFSTMRLTLATTILVLTFKVSFGAPAKLRRSSSLANDTYFFCGETLYCLTNRFTREVAGESVGLLCRCIGGWVGENWEKAIDECPTSSVTRSILVSALALLRHTLLQRCVFHSVWVQDIQISAHIDTVQVDLLNGYHTCRPTHRRIATCCGIPRDCSLALCNQFLETIDSCLRHVQ